MKPFERQKAEAIEKLRPYSLKIVSRAQIDISQWDKCIANAVNETPLAYSWVLDILNPEWQGLIINNYEGVMPLPVHNLMGMPGIQMPIEVLTLGLYSGDQKLINLFPQILFHPVLKKFRFIQYNGSPSNSTPEKHFQCQIKQTFELSLAHTYDVLYRRYSRNHRRSIRYFEATRLEISNSDVPDNFTQLIREIGKQRPELFMPHAYQTKFEAMARSAIEREMGSTYSVYEGDRLIGTAFFLAGKKRIIPYHIANNAGRQNKTSFALIDHFIRKHAGSNKTIDFAGSVIPNVAAFNQRFGAVPVPYCSVKINHLPQPLKWVKEKNLLFRFKRWLVR